MSSRKTKRLRQKHTNSHGRRAQARLGGILSTPAGKRSGTDRGILAHLKRQMGLGGGTRRRSERY